MTPKEFQKSHLALELKAGKKRLEDALHGLSDEHCETAGAMGSGSVVDLLSEIDRGCPFAISRMRKMRCRARFSGHW